MKILRFLAIAALLPAVALSSFAAVPAVTVPAPDSAIVSRQGNLIQVKMTLPLAGIKVGSNNTVILEPVLANGADSIVLTSVGVMGRNRYIHYERGASEALPDLIMSASKAVDLPYTATEPWQEWMDGATLSLRRTDYGCCANIEGEAVMPLTLFELPRPFAPVFSFLRPSVEEVKTRSVTGRAFIDFPVNRTEIRPSYRRNADELAKIRATIDSVASDPDITVRSIAIKGFASPEGSYANNVRLARGRTESLRDYVARLYNFSPSVYSTSYEPEDWQGLIEWLTDHSIDHRDAILAIARDTTIAPDPRDNRIRADFPAQYRMLLADVYPALRHSDYTIDFEIRSFTDVDELRRLALSAPQKLSLNELFIAATSYPTGSPDFNTVMDIAVRMYPSSEVANLNAANTAMERGDLRGAAAFLDKAGDSPEAIYARANLAALEGDNARALDLFRQAARLKVADAPAAIDQIERIIRLTQ